MITFIVEYYRILIPSLNPVDTRYCGDIGFLLVLHRNIDRLSIEIEVT